MQFPVACYGVTACVNARSGVDLGIWGGLQKPRNTVFYSLTATGRFLTLPRRIGMSGMKQIRTTLMIQKMSR